MYIVSVEETSHGKAGSLTKECEATCPHRIDNCTQRGESKYRVLCARSGGPPTGMYSGWVASSQFCFAGLVAAQLSIDQMGRSWKRLAVASQRSIKFRFKSRCRSQAPVDWGDEGNGLPTAG